MNVLQNNRGVTLVFVALGLLLFLLFLGVAVDTGWMVYVRAQGQARIDSAALAAAGALVEDNPLCDGGQGGSEGRECRAKKLANTFSDRNSVVNETVDPVNVVTPMKYHQDSDVLEEAPYGWNMNNGSDVNCNAVRVTTAVPTPVFFAGIRNVFGATETGKEDIAVSAVAHLPCPGMKLTADGFGQFGSLALRQCAWKDNAELCPSQDIVEITTQEVKPFIVRWNATAPIEVDKTITLGQEIQDATDAKMVTAPYLCIQNRAITVPVIEATEGQCGPGVKNLSTTGLVLGFATICFSQSAVPTGEQDPNGQPKFLTSVVVEVQCGKIASSSTGTGQCFGTLASSPILVQ